MLAFLTTPDPTADLPEDAQRSGRCVVHHILSCMKARRLDYV